MDRRRLGELSLRLDAAYCAAAAVAVALFADPLSQALFVSTWVVIGAAAGTALWALTLLSAARGSQVRRWLVGVLASNVVAATLVAALAVTRARDAFALLLVAVALEVAAFAVSQALALRCTASG